jgi:beta-glucanase (GH16 family)
MQYLRLARLAMAGTAVAGSILLTACGGGADASGDTAVAATAAAPTLDPSASASAAKPAAQAANTTTTTTARAAGYTVLPDELIQNGLFANGLTAWTVTDAALVPSEVRKGGQALNVGYKATQTFQPTALQAGRSYTLFVRARNDRSTGTSQLNIRFRKPAYSEVIRSYAVTVASSTYQNYTIEFTAPAYAAMADFVITANGARTIVDGVSMKMRSAIPQTEYIASNLGSYVPAGYTLAFNDEFNGTALNRSKWMTRFIYGGGTQDKLNDEKQRYRDNNNHVVANGVLSLVARKVSSTDPDGINYESGMIRSDWTARYGYYEARVKMPGGLGVWPAFWLNSDVSPEGRLAWPPEIDIFEFVNNGAEDKVNMIHSNVVAQSGTTSTLMYTDAAFNTSWADYVAPFNFNEGWHTIGAQWDPDTVTVFVDGLKIYTRTYKWNYADGTLAGPAHILLNLAIGGSWAGRHGIDDAAFPQALQIDWVRAYTKN